LIEWVNIVWGSVVLVVGVGGDILRVCFFVYLYFGVIYFLGQ
jgi:hypothetical protein